MRISVIGCGYLGAVHAACMAALGHDVIGIEVDETRRNLLAKGLSPFHEPGLDIVLHESVAQGRLRFPTDPAPEELEGVDMHFLCVGTPQLEAGRGADLSALHLALDALMPFLHSGERPLVVGKSTVPVGTAADLAARVAPTGAILAWNPEFLREGSAVDDTLHPDRLVYGLPADATESSRARMMLDELYAPLIDEGVPRILADYATAELIKVAANSFLATKTVSSTPWPRCARHAAPMSPSSPTRSDATRGSAGAF